ncbi:MAG: MFS transporter [Candidatus Doudnabacteria bacterium]
MNILSNLKTPKFIILFTVFVDILGLGIVIPVLPFYIKSFGVSDFIVTALFAVFSLFSFISAPFLGALSDRIGRRPVLIASIASTAFGWLIFAAARTVPIMFLGRIIDGSAAGNISTAQSYLVDISKDPKERSSNLGLIGAMFGIGLTIGPLIGGTLGSISHTLPFWTVGGLASLNAIMAYFWLPETHHTRDTSRPIELNPMAPIIRATKNSKLLPGYISWFLFGLAAASQQAIFSLYLNHIFGFKEFVAGLFFTFIGIALSINQAIFIKRFWIKKFKEPQLELYMMLVFAVGFLFMDIQYLAFFIFGVLLVTIGQSVLRVVMSSQMVGASLGQQGETLGVMTSVMSLSMIVGPLTAGWLFIKNPSLPFLFSSMAVMLAFVLILLNRKKLAVENADENTPTSFAV